MVLTARSYSSGSLERHSKHLCFHLYACSQALFHQGVGPGRAGDFHLTWVSIMSLSFLSISASASSTVPVGFQPCVLRLMSPLVSSHGALCQSLILCLIGVGGTPDPMANVIDIEGLSCWDIVT